MHNEYDTFDYDTSDYDTFDYDTFVLSSYEVRYQMYWHVSFM